MSNDYAVQMRAGLKLPPEAKAPNGRLAAYEASANDRGLVQVMASNGVPLDIMAKVLKIARGTLNKHYKQEIADGWALVTARMGVALVKEGLAGNVAAQRYWLGTHGGPEWRIQKEETTSGVFDAENPHETVHFYMPSNGRDKPEELEIPTIDGEATEAA